LLPASPLRALPLLPRISGCAGAHPASWNQFRSPLRNAFYGGLARCAQRSSAAAPRAGGGWDYRVRHAAATTSLAKFIGTGMRGAGALRQSAVAACVRRHQQQKNRKRNDNGSGSYGVKSNGGKRGGVRAAKTESSIGAAASA